MISFTQSQKRAKWIYGAKDQVVIIFEGVMTRKGQDMLLIFCLDMGIRLIDVFTSWKRGLLSSWIMHFYVYMFYFH